MRPDPSHLFGGKSSLKTTDRLKIAHFAEWGPHRCGMYHTVRDMVLAERLAGLESVFIDTTVDDKGRVVCPPGIRYDGSFYNVPEHLAETADVLVRHSIIPKKYRELGKPMMMCLHGRPEYSFLLEHYSVRGVFMEEITCARLKEYAGYIYFWPEYHNYWNKLLPDADLFYVPAMLDMDEWQPDGKTYDFGEKNGSPNILIADMWREDVTPFNTVFAALRACEHWLPDAKIHIIGMKTKLQHTKVLINTLKRTGFLGQIAPQLKDPAQFYRAADMVVTPHVIANRIVRESLACGTPVVAGEGSIYTPYTGSHLDVRSVSEAIRACWKDIQGGVMTRTLARQTAMQHFNLLSAGHKASNVYNHVVRASKIKKAKVALQKALKAVGG